jgi:hypothetical protein
MVKVCCAVNCDNNSLEKPGIRFFKLPKTPERRDQWLRRIGRDSEFEPSRDTAVCSDHFASDCFVADSLPESLSHGGGLEYSRRRKLASGAVPTLFKRGPEGRWVEGNEPEEGKDQVARNKTAEQGSNPEKSEQKGKRSKSSASSQEENDQERCSAACSSIMATNDEGYVRQISDDSKSARAMEKLKPCMVAIMAIDKTSLVRDKVRALEKLNDIEEGEIVDVSTAGDDDDGDDDDEAAAAAQASGCFEMQMDAANDVSFG